jgi:hypothetical protein
MLRVFSQVVKTDPGKSSESTTEDPYRDLAPALGSVQDLATFLSRIEEFPRFRFTLTIG